MESNDGRPEAVTVTPARRICTVREMGVRIEHHYMHDGVIQRYLVLEKQELRELLDKPRRTRIEDAKGDPEQLIKEAKTALKELLQACQLKSMAREQEHLNRRLEHVTELSKLKRAARDALPALEIGYTLASDPEARYEPGTAEGAFLFAGERPNRAFGVDLYQDDGQIRRIESEELRPLIDSLRLTVGDPVRVAYEGVEEVEIIEITHGVHGETENKLAHRRDVFRIERLNGEDEDEQTYSDREPGRGSGTEIPPEYASDPSLHDPDRFS